MANTKKQDMELMGVLKLREISRIICDTDMGTLKLSLRKGEDDYRFMLDSVPLPKELHKEVWSLLYVPEIPQPAMAPNYGSIILPLADIAMQGAMGKDGDLKKGKQPEPKKAK